jgi:hypothetical protein
MGGIWLAMDCAMGVQGGRTILAVFCQVNVVRWLVSRSEVVVALRGCWFSPRVTSASALAESLARFARLLKRRSTDQPQESDPCSPP